MGPAVVAGLSEVPVVLVDSVVLVDDPGGDVKGAVDVVAVEPPALGLAVVLGSAVRVCEIPEAVFL